MTGVQVQGEEQQPKFKSGYVEQAQTAFAARVQPSVVVVGAADDVDAADDPIDVPDTVVGATDDDDEAHDAAQMPLQQVPLSHRPILLS